MARENGKKKRQRTRYFYLDGNLHKILSVNRGRDFVIAWHYPEKKRKMYVWSDAQRRMQKAFSITEAAVIFNKHRMTIDEYIREGWIKTPQRTYKLDTGAPGKFMFSEDEMLELFEFIQERNRGVRDGMNRQEAEALVRTNQVLYTEVDGELVPLWKEKFW